MDNRDNARYKSRSCNFFLQIAMNTKGKEEKT